MRQPLAFSLILATVACSDPAPSGADAATADTPPSDVAGTCGLSDASTRRDADVEPYASTLGFVLRVTPNPQNPTSTALVVEGTAGDLPGQLRSFMCGATTRIGRTPSVIQIRRATIELGGTPIGVERFDDFLDAMSVTVHPVPIAGETPELGATVVLGEASRAPPARWGLTPAVLSGGIGRVDALAPVQRYLLAGSLEGTGSASRRTGTPVSFQASVTVSIELVAIP